MFEDHREFCREIFSFWKEIIVDFLEAEIFECSREFLSFFPAEGIFGEAAAASDLKSFPIFLIIGALLLKNKRGINSSKKKKRARFKGFFSTARNPSSGNVYECCVELEGLEMLFTRFEEVKESEEEEKNGENMAHTCVDGAWTR